MQEKIQKLELEIQRDSNRLEKQQEALKKKKERLEALKNEDLLKRVSKLQSDGISISEVLNAIEAHDLDYLQCLLETQKGADPHESSGIIESSRVRSHYNQ